jgi:hypothetical protein
VYGRVSTYVGWIEGVTLEVGAKEAAELLGDPSRDIRFSRKQT